MGRISSGVGLISGLPVQDLVNQLLAVEARPITLVQNQATVATAQRTAFSDLTAKLLAVQSSSNALSSASVLSARTAASSDETRIQATAQPLAAKGSYNFRPIRQVQTQQLVSTGYTTADATAVGAGEITVKLGGFVQPSTSLAGLNGGQGIRRGQIQITDRSGATATVDLRGSATVDDVLSAINNAAGVRVRASVSGDRIVVSDLTGQTTTNLTIADFGGGKAALDLGLASSVGSATLTGADVVKLSGSTSLSLLNDKNGVGNQRGLDDFRITTKSGATIDVDLDNAQNIQGVLNAINNDSQNSGQVVAAIAAGGDRITLTDTTGGGGTLSVSALSSSSAAADLGILGDEQGGGVLSGGRLLAGLGTVLLKNLRGGSGVASLGQVQFTDRSGATATVDFSAASSLGDVIAGVNSAGLGLVAAVNAAGNGITLTDTTGATTSNLIVADVGGSTVAANLGLTSNVASANVSGSDLALKYVSENTLLSSLNGGAGVQLGKFSVTNSAGSSGLIDISTAKTVGDAITALNSSGVGVSARINDTGDGILLTDIGGGGGSLTVAEEGGNTARDLRLLGSASGSIDGAQKTTITIDADDTLNDVVGKIGAAGAGVTASVLNDGGAEAGFHLVLTSSKSGLAGQILIDTGATGISFSKLTEAADALLEVGSGGPGAVLATSATNSFSSVLPGLSLTLTGSGSGVVNVAVGGDSEPLISAVKQFVNNFNNARDKLRQVTSFDTETTTRAVLQADGLALRADNALAGLFSRNFGAANSPVRQLSDLGVTMKGGKLSLDEGKLRSVTAAQPEAVRQFFETGQTGFAASLESTLDAFTDSIDGSLVIRDKALQTKLTSLQDRMEFMNTQLDGRRARLQQQFSLLEQTLAQLQSQQSSLSRLASLSSTTTSSSK